MGVDPRADFATFYVAELPRVVAQVYAVGGDLADAEEVAQEAFVRAWSHWRTLCAYDDPGGWTVLVAQRISVSRWRRRQVARRHLRAQRSMSDVEGPGPDSVLLVAALRRLPVDYQRVLVLHYLADRTVADIAEVERCSQGAVKARLVRARTALASVLTEPAGSTAPGDGSAS